ncbi:MAG: helix-turn-helix transcriptional regulator [Treponema sp.]|jgi:DNA-binding CsgD family transcriptional regulator|nr:helix-turn-helix transcriptional regulator [Treponema sp.]
MELVFLIHFFLGFICSIGFYAFFYRQNRPAQKWRSIVLLIASTLGYPLCEIWMSGNPQQFNSVHASISYALYLIWLTVCILAGTNRSRTLVGTAFILCFGYSVQMPIGFFIGHVSFSLDTTLFLETLHQTQKLRYVLAFFGNCSVTGSCFLAVHWLRKIQSKPPFKLCAVFTVVFISILVINQVWWKYTINSMNNIPWVILAFLGLLLTATPVIILYLFTRLAVHAENISGGVQTTADSPPTIAVSDVEPLWTQEHGLSPKFCERYTLTDREKNIVEVMMKGKSNKEIAEALFISQRTVEKYLQNVYQKTDVSNRFALYSMIKGE